MERSSHRISSNRNWFIVISLLIVVILFRLPIILYGMPFDLGDEDENALIGCALNYGASKTIIPIHNWYPALFSYILALCFGVYYLFSLVLGHTAETTDFAVHYLTSPGYFHLIGRLVALCFSCASVTMAYLCGLKYKDSLSGIIAAMSFTFSTTVIWRTSWAFPSSLFIFMTLVSVFFVLRYLSTGKISDIMLSGLFCGLGIAGKYNVGTLISVGLMGILIRHSLAGDGINFIKGLINSVKSKEPYIYGGFVVFGFCIGSPNWLLDFGNALSALQWEIGRLSVESSGSSFYLSRLPFVWIFSEMVIMETTLGICLIISMAYTMMKAIKGDALSYLYLPFILISFFMIGKYQKHSLHYLLPVLPILFIIFGKTVSDLIEDHRRKGFRLLALLIIIFCLPMLNSLSYIGHFTKKDTRIAAQEWIIDNVPFGTFIGIGRTINSPPLPDANRFSRPYYSMYSEQVLSQRLPDSIKNKYYSQIADKAYYLANYVVKRNVGRRNSYSSMIADFDILNSDEISRIPLDYIIFTSSDIYFLNLNGYRSIQDIPGFSGLLELKKSFTSKTKKFIGPDIWIYKVKTEL